jgi:predicted phage terminase large subunit-like protein
MPNDLSDIDRLLSDLEARKRATALRPEGSVLDFAKWFFVDREGMAFIEGPHHRVMARVLDEVLQGKRNRVIITPPPGYTKTDMAVVNFIAKGFQVNPGARFIHATFSDPLARENSDKIMEIMENPEYAAIAGEQGPAKLRHDTTAKDRWKTEQGGGLLAKSAGGPITGFRAGLMDKKKFTGALVVDDPLKPDDAFFPKKRQNVNKRATNTFRSRLAHEGVPILVIMQRLHDDDFVGHLLRGGSGDVWDHLDLSVWIDRDREYPKDWTHGRPIPHDLPNGPLWEEKHSAKEIEILKVDEYTYASQYDGRPVSVEGALFDMDYLNWYSAHQLPPIEYCMVFGDTAQKTEERNDYSVFQLWGKQKNGPNIYLIDQIRGKWSAPDLEKYALAFWKRHRILRQGSLRSLQVEDKSSGTGLIQSLSRSGIPVRGIQRERDKYMRGLDTAPYVKSGYIYLPEDRPFTNDLRIELQRFDGLGTGHDDQVDPLMDAVEKMLGGRGYRLQEAMGH